MLNKVKVVKAIQSLFSTGSIGFSHLAGIIIQKPWYVPDETDFPNYKFIYKLCNEYIEFSKTLDIPDKEGIIYENTIRYLASLAKQDPAYDSRFNGMLFRVLKDYQRGSIRPTGNDKYLKFLVGFWAEFDGRERNHDLYKKFLEWMVSQYATEPFYKQSIDWCLNWIGEHQSEFVYSDSMNPKNWYGNNGVGFVDNLCMGGMG
jgi:hypothetical protein